MLAERHAPEVEALVGAVVDARRDAWRSMIARAEARGEVPPGTDAQLVLDVVRAIVDAGAAEGRLDAAWMRTAIRTVLARARQGTLARGHGGARGPRGA